MMVVCRYFRCSWVSSNLEWLHEGPQQYSDGVALPEQLDKSGGAEKSQEPDVDEVFLQNIFIRAYR